MKKAFFLAIMSRTVGLPLGMVVSSHSAPGCDVVFISEHGEAFLEMGSETVFSTSVMPVSTAY